ncbi:hypothetical protein L1987_82638 [Smallanthus sonchifolius]|uniref:Uncharacterized protein n=1 Tax=Smallanthus sonchifolius TaxID=185202 RepID=A0ACB8YBR7_9ASTR|nr:hypothetical protein L1987_82638 [Smallanthus sonchifolius]
MPKRTSSYTGMSLSLRGQFANNRKYRVPKVRNSGRRQTLCPSFKVYNRNHNFKRRLLRRHISSDLHPQ